jgi:putative component of membrane protein insertase Oxa1/YidC/SpoIIIJ protein YidD
MKFIALAAIRFYQRVLSPHKGFRCAYCAYTGRASCSALGYRAIRRFGLWQGLSVLDRRLEKCGVAYRRYRPATQRPFGMLGKQAGFLDCACDSASCDLLGGAVDVAATALDCATCDCSRRPWRRDRSRDDEYVVIPPRRNGRD